MYAGGGILPERAWPAAHYARVARGLCEAGHAVGLIGLKDDAAAGPATCIAAIGSDACMDLTGYTRSIRELLMLFHASDLLITNDGGPGHFASLTPIQTMVFFGPETGKLYGPLGSTATHVLESRHCLLTLPVRLQPPPDLLRWRQPVPQAHRTRSGAGPGAELLARPRLHAHDPAPVPP